MSQARDLFLEIQHHAREASNAARDLRDSAQNGQPLDAAALERIRESGRRVIALKYELIGVLPDVGGMPLGRFYREMQFIDELVDLACSLMFQLRRSDKPRRTRQMIEQMLRVLKGELDWLRSSWPPHSNDGFSSIERNLENVLQRLPDTTTETEGIEDLTYEIHNLKLFAAGALPEQIFETDLGFWYENLKLLDAAAVCVRFAAERVEREFGEDTATELDQMTFLLLTTLIPFGDVIPE